MSDEPTAPLDLSVLEALLARGRTHSLVDSVSLAEDEAGRTALYFQLDPDRYPPLVESAFVRWRWYTNGDYRIHYREEWIDKAGWQCRWDRHPHTHDTPRSHFHEPPDGSGEPVSDPSGETPPMETFSRTMANIHERIETLWEEPTE